MSDKQTLTISLPKALVRKAKIAAKENGTSLSELITQLLRDLVEQRKQYDSAKRSQLQLMKDGLDLGTQGEINWSRNSLYE